jgi:ComF family protein
VHPRLSECLEGLTALLFPPVCLHCGNPVQDESPLRSLCKACSLNLHRVRPPACTCCGHPFYGPDERAFYCEHCVGLKPVFGEGRTLVLFHGPARSLMHELTYHHGLHVLRDMGRVACADPSLADWARGGILVPVPMHPRKRRERGYNQTELIAEELLRCGVGLRLEKLLVRRADGKSQTAFDRMARLGNLKNAFAPLPGASITPDHRYILLDDVFTTGSTLNRCAQVLREAGASRVDVLSFGHG